jgi:aminoglycoside phosphotransferase (APT) family kinase protein
VAKWLEDTLGGRVISLQRQSRWRPVWMVDLEHDNEVLPLMVRGDRTDTEYTWSLEHEMRFQRVMHEQGIRTPKVYGWIDNPAAFVTQRYSGQADFTAVGSVDRDKIVDEYVQELVRFHAIDVRHFADAGIDRAASPNDSGALGFDRMVAMFRRQKNHPDPQMEFFLGWLKRNPPRSRGRESAVVWDSGQFMHESGKFLGIIDVELGHIGDPMMDLAGWRMRDSVMGFGDFEKIYDRYGELAGSPVDREAIQLHHIFFTLSNQLAFAHAVFVPPPESDLATNLQWCNETNLYATEALAEYLDIELPTAEIPEATISKAAPAYAHLTQLLRTLSIDDEFAAYRLRGAFRVARHLQRHDEIGAQVLAADIDDAHELLGHRPADWATAEQELEQFVLRNSDNPALDAKLCAFFHRRNLRAQMLNGPAGSAMARHLPIQRFAR